MYFKDFSSTPSGILSLGEELTWDLFDFKKK
jgi:hypothetical protein